PAPDRAPSASWWPSARLHLPESRHTHECALPLPPDQSLASNRDANSAAQLQSCRPPTQPSDFPAPSEFAPLPPHQSQSPRFASVAIAAAHPARAPLACAPRPPIRPQALLPRVPKSTHSTGGWPNPHPPDPVLVQTGTTNRYAAPASAPWCESKADRTP